MKKISRRNLLVGGATAAGAGMLGLHSTLHAATDRGSKNLIIVVASGGWDTTYSLDPKPGVGSIDAPVGDIEELGGIPVFTDASRPAARALFDNHAAITTVVNGLTVQSLVHTDCAKRVMTGTPSDTAPDFGAITANELGRDLPAPYLVLGQTSFSGPYASIATRAGTANQVGTLLDPARAFPPESGDFSPRFVPDSAEAALIRAHVLARAQREKALRGIVGVNESRYRDFIESLARGDELAATADFGGFDYTLDLGVQSQIALDVLEQGISRVVQMEIGGFDTHDNNAFQAVKQDELFAGLAALIDELAARDGADAGSKMLDETVVVVVSEMGRTPLLNDALGKDHWPVTSAMILGGGTSGGRVLGATTDAFLSEPMNLKTGELDDGGGQLGYSNFAAGLLNLVGVDAAEYLPGAEAFDALCV
ncbi:MAG: DUF1501 domain-containing protein [Nannocystaceae bacterium]|nr:DUF1501 domain-containing protein [Nannocystaceae bacterium]